MRLFVGIELEGGIRDAISGIISRLGRHDFDVKFVKPGNIHITLKFLGEVPDSHIGGIGDAISESIRGFGRFYLGIGGLGYFSNRGQIRTLWVGVKEGREELVKLARSLEGGLSHVRREAREPEPHITIGRFRSGKNIGLLPGIVRGMAAVDLGGMDVKEIVLKRSELGRDGPAYTDVRVFELGGNNG